MIRLTKSGTGEPIYVSPEHLVEVGYDDKQTLVSTLAEGWYVQESPEEVVRKVLEWRLAMERYRAALITGKHEIALAECQHLKQLAGLEEQA